MIDIVHSLAHKTITTIAIKTDNSDYQIARSSSFFLTTKSTTVFPIIVRSSINTIYHLSAKTARSSY